MNAEETMIKIVNVTKAFGSFTAIDRVSLDIPRGGFTTLLGPSGCGKTTLLRLIAGFYQPDSGDIFIDGVRVNGVPAFRRNTPLVFQDYALFPHMTVFENVAYGLKLRKVPKAEMAERVRQTLGMFGLEGLEKRYPKQLSGGQQQRVAFARALVTGQNVLLMDEPLSNLDAKMRVEVRNELKELQRRTGITAVFVTHDQDEALSLSDRVAVFNKGKILQVGTPWEIYFKPQSRFVADFVGVANFLDGEVEGVEAGDLVVHCHGHRIRVDKSDYSVQKGDKVTLVIRPECISISFGAEDAAGENAWTGVIRRSIFLGRMIRYWVDAGPMEWTVDDPSPIRHHASGESVRISLDKAKIHVLPAER